MKDELPNVEDDGIEDDLQGTPEKFVDGGESFVEVPADEDDSEAEQD